MSTPVAPLALAFAAARLRIEAPRAPRRRGACCSAVTGARGAARRPIRCIARSGAASKCQSRARDIIASVAEIATL